MLQFSKDKKPIVVWNSTSECNLFCVHCYANAKCEPAKDELSTAEARAMIDDLAGFGVPTLLFSGGEPLMRKDLFELGDYARSKNIRAVISTNGTLINEDAAQKIKDAGFSYVGISLDGIAETNDRFRGVPGAFDMAMAGIENCMDKGIKVGLRFTINKSNYKEIPFIFDTLKDRSIPRVCFYHLVYAGRGTDLLSEEVPLPQSRKTVEYIFERTQKLYDEGHAIEVLTVDNHVDGVLLYLKMLERNPERAAEILTLLQYNGGNNSGIAISCVDQHGEVHADQFWRHYSFGNIRKRPFSKIWPDLSDELMGRLKNRKPHLKGRCKICKYLNICNGNFRVRAEAIFNDTWAPDPACYLSDAEIGMTSDTLKKLKADNQLYEYDWMK